MKKNMRIWQNVRRGFVAIAIGLAAGWCGAAGPLVDYGFDETGTSAPSGGSLTDSLSLYNGSGVLTDYHGAAGSGVSGMASDRALDFSSANGMGNQALVNSCHGRHASDIDGLDQLTSFTLSGWFKTSYPGETLDRYAYLMNNGDNTTGWQLYGQLRYLYLRIGSLTVATSSGAYDEANKWMFFAVTYDGTQSSSNLRFYRGYRNGTESTLRPVLELVTTGTLNAGTPAADGQRLYVGNYSTTQRPFRGYLDNLRIHGSKTDASGVLSFDDLEAYRAADGIPGSNLLLEYRFNETGTNAFSSGYYTLPMNMKSFAGVATDYHTAAGAGVSGDPDDRALDMRSALTWGSGGEGPLVQHAADQNEIDQLQSFTLSGWFNTSTNGVMDRYARIMSQRVGNIGFYLFAFQGSMYLQVDDQAAVAVPYPETNQWIFFGVTYDGSLTSGNVKFYKGSRRSPVSCIATNTINAGRVETESYRFSVGCDPYEVNGRPFKGLLDEIRIHGAHRDGTGALTTEALEQLRLLVCPSRGTALLVR